MYRGTTPTITLELDTDVSLADLAEIWVTFKTPNAEVNKTFKNRIEKYNADGTWSQVGGTIDYVLTSRCFTRIAVAPDGTPFIVYPNEIKDDTKLKKTIEVRYFDSEAKQWSAPVTLAEGDFADPDLSIGFDSKGKGYVTLLDENKVILYTFQ